MALGTPETTTLAGETENYSSAHLVHALMQFAVAVRRRINVVVLALVAAGLLGGLYYATATRYYSAKAQLLVLRAGDDVATSMAQGGLQQNLMPTYEGLFTSTTVLEAALQYLLPEDRVDLSGLPREQWVASLRSRLWAKAIQSANIIEIEYRSKDPAAAVAVVNAVVRSYLEFMEKTHKGTAGEIVRLLTNEKTELIQRLAKKEEERQQIRSQLGLVGSLGTNREALHPLVARALSFNEALIETQKARVGLEASLAAIELAVRNGEDLRQHLLNVSDVVGREFLMTALGMGSRDTSTLAAIDQKLVGDRARLSALEVHCGPKHPQVLRLRDEIRAAEDYLQGFQQRAEQRLAEMHRGQLGALLVGMVQQRLKEVRQKEATLEVEYHRAYGEANQLNSQLARLEMAEFDVKWLRDLHETLLKKLADVNLRQEGTDIRTSIVSEPVKNGSPISPRLGMVLLMVAVGGLSAGLLVVYVLDILDDRFRSVEELQSQLGVPVLTVVRPLPARSEVGLAALESHVEPDAPASEAFRTLRTALSLANGPSRQLVFTSAEPGDGKTTVLANLAVCYAQSARKTLLVDADLRRPGLTALLGMKGVDGLSSVMRGQEDVVPMAVRTIRASGLPGLDVLPSGPRPTNPAELLSGVRLSELLAWAETVYDQILIDSPPTLAASDTALIGRLVDGVVLVVQPAKNRRRIVLRAAEGLAVLKIPVLGTAVNQAGHGRDDYGYGNGYGYEYQYTGEPETERADSQGVRPPQKQARHAA